MNKKQYEKPSVEVVVLKQEPLMQEVSGQGQAGVQNYNIIDEPEV